MASAGLMQRGSYTGLPGKYAVDFELDFFGSCFLFFEFRAEGASKPVWFRLVRVTR